MRKLESLGAKNILTYALVIKQNAKYVPHYFGVVVGDHDRTLFLLDSIPNNRLFAKDYPRVILRKLTEEDCHTNASLDTGLPSMDKIEFNDLLYQKEAHGHEVFVIELDGKIASFVSLKFTVGKMLIDLLATDRAYAGKGF